MSVSNAAGCLPASRKGECPTNIWEVKKQIELGYFHKFDWTVYKNNDKVKHTGLLLCFDSQPCFSVDFGASSFVSGALALGTGSSTSSGFTLGTINAANMENRKVFSPIQTVNLMSYGGEEEASGLIDILCEPYLEAYHATRSNCRHHVRRRIAEIKKEVEEQRISAEIDETALKEVEEMLDGQVHNDNYSAGVVAGAVAGSILCAAAAVVAKLN